jgi:membrane-bound lytic murein transglycosylase B
VVEHDRKQPEVTQTFSEYMARRVTAALVAEGRKALRQHRALLEAVRRAYGVQPRFIVALWGVETRYGRYGGGYPVIASLVTLAYDARRARYFRRELLDALQILDAGHITPERMKGSWAGAMGQNQFMPSSFVRYAVDFDGDGRRDIWTTLADVFASSANYLANAGWRGDQTWGREVRLPAGFDLGLVGHGVRKRLSEWQRLGVRRANGGDLPRRDLLASVIMPGGPEGPAFVVYDKYRAILKWKRSDYFGMSVGRLADLIGSG